MPFYVINENQKVIMLDVRTIKALEDYQKAHEHIEDLDHAVIDAIVKAELFYAANESI